MWQAGTQLDEHVGVLIVEGQRHGVWVRSEPDDDGLWHNALLFRREGHLAPARAHITGVDWHTPPGFALDRARLLTNEDQFELYRRARRPRPPFA